MNRLMQSHVIPGTTPPPIRAFTSVTFATSPTDNPLTSRAKASMMLALPPGAVMYRGRVGAILGPAGRSV